ncbi:MAG: DUF2383 domain-containing protein [Caldilineaceae bacterium]
MQSEQTSLAHILSRLSQACRASQEAYVDAAQHTRNRGLKLVLKSYAQERAHFQEQLRTVAGESPEPVAEATGSALGRGWASLRAWVTIRRQSRQRMLMQKAVESDKAAIATYEDALRQSLPGELDKLLRDQLSALYQAEVRIVSLAAPRRDGALLVRLYERPEQVVQVVSALEGAGVQRDQVYVADVERLAPYANDKSDRERARWETMAAAAVVGAVIGCLIVLPFAFAQRIYFPQLNGIIADSPTGVLIEYLVGGALVGAIFGLYFSIFIGQDIVEDDAYFYEQSLENGKVLVAVPATPTNRAEVEKVLGLQHQFEVKPQTA